MCTGRPGDAFRARACLPSPDHARAANLLVKPLRRADGGAWVACVTVLTALYLVAVRVFQLVIVALSNGADRDVELLVLRHELAVLRGQVSRVRYRPADRLILAAFSRVLSRSRWHALSVIPATLLACHRRALARKWTYPHK